MQNSVLEKIKLCHKHRDYDTAIFLALYLSNIRSEYLLLTGILLYENGEYSRSLFYLEKLNTITAIYYQALAHKKMCAYTKSLCVLRKLMKNSWLCDPPADPWTSSFYISGEDSEFSQMLMAQLYTLRGNTKDAIDRHRAVMLKNPLLPSAEALYLERNSIPALDELQTDIVMKYYLNLLEIPEMQPSDPKYLAYLEQGNFGSYFLSKAASTIVQYVSENEGMAIFQRLRETDPFYMTDLDVYSVFLWRNKEKDLLGLLAKEALASDPYSWVTWIIVANYYSLHGKNKECMLALKKSLSIKETPQVYTLLGFESNIKAKYIDAIKYFKVSLAMRKFNDRANFGLGIAYCERSMNDKAEELFRKAMEINPYSSYMKAFIVRFHVKTLSYQIALVMIKSTLKLPDSPYKNIVESIEMHSHGYSPMEDLILCEFADILIHLKHPELATRVLSCIEYRTSTYYAKRALLEAVELY
ncbi:hypothetical protein ENBRE01_0181 [Enteropsectra breve]|nr:hypothetical protein ENBRE01_0181 [Enteropsectra breve]